MIVYGSEPVAEALKAGRVKRLLVGRRDDQRLQRLLALASPTRCPVERVEPGELDRRSRDGVHQGVVAEVSAAREYSVGDLVQDAGGPALLVVLDGIEDPHNVGAILRSVDASGAHGVIRQTRRAAALDTVAAKASAGAVSHVPVADVVNIARAIDELKQQNVWVVGLAGDASQSYESIDWTAAVGHRAGRRRQRDAPAGPRIVRLPGVDPDGRPRRQPERLGGGRRGAVRGRPAAAERKSASPRYPCRLSHFGLESSGHRTHDHDHCRPGCHAGYGGFDNAFIYYTFARKSCRRSGFVWCAGCDPIYGATSIPYAVILAVAHWCGVPPPIMADYCRRALLGSYKFEVFALARARAPVWVAWGASMVSAFSLAAPELSLGMETGLVAWLSLLTLRLYGQRRDVEAFLARAVLTLTRIDGLLVSYHSRSTLPDDGPGVPASAPEILRAAGLVNSRKVLELPYPA